MAIFCSVLWPHKNDPQGFLTNHKVSFRRKKKIKAIKAKQANKSVNIEILAQAVKNNGEHHIHARAIQFAFKHVTKWKIPAVITFASDKQRIK